MQQSMGPDQKRGIAQRGYFLPEPTQDKEKPHGKKAGRAREDSGSSRSPVLGDVQVWIQSPSATYRCGCLQVLLCVPGAGDLCGTAWHLCGSGSLLES